PLPKRCYGERPGGKRRGVFLARALCPPKKTLLLGEPVAGLDPQATLEMYEIIKTLNNQGITIIMISHDIASACKYASHILHLGGQSILFFGTASAYLSGKLGNKYAAIGGE
ncbi:MAG: ABC transporter, partial [Clostridiales bacterium]|nr:ABC transporter [Clostridiales bacterium]